MTYRILFKKTAAKNLSKLDKNLQQKIIVKLEYIASNQDPTLFGKPLLGNKKGLWRFREQNYRIIVQIKKKELIILILDV